MISRVLRVGLLGLALLAAFPTALASTSPSTFTNNWAVLVCTSRFWFNYRHMANALAMYRTVKRLGIPDSQIILMLADDAACNPRNPFAATVYSNMDRKTDLYGDKIEVDYKGDEVNVETFLRLLSGRLPESTPASKRLMTDERSNIFVFMTGHGGDEFLKFQDNEEISAFDLADAFGGMWAKKRYHEILFMVDTCQANTLYSKFYSPNILATGSSKKDENSYSHHADGDIGLAVTDRYTHHVLTFLEGINKTSKVSVQNLFDTFSYEILHSTAGVRSDLFPRPLTETLLTDFFGGVSEVELSSEDAPAPPDAEEVHSVGAEKTASPSGHGRKRRRADEGTKEGEETSSLVPLLAGAVALQLGGLPLSALARSTARCVPSSSSHSPSPLRPSSQLRTLHSTPPALVSVPRPARKDPPPLKTPERVREPNPATAASRPSTELFEALKKVPAVRTRPTIINEDSARELVRAWGVDRMQDVVVVDSYAGPGGLTRAFLELPNVKKVIAIEDAHRYAPMLNTLKERYGDRFVHVDEEPFLWEAYTAAEEHFKHDIPKVPFSEGPHPNLFFSAQFPNSIYGNLMCIQLLSAISGEMWFYQYGRLQMGFTGADSFWKKLFAPPGDPSHHKLSVLVPTLADVQRIQTLSDFRPAEQHFHKPRGDPALFGAVKVTPHEKPRVKNYDALEFITRNMFVGKATPWPRALASVCPGATNLVEKAVAAGVTDTKKTVTQLTLDEWIILADVFEAWPFRPQTLFDDFSFAEERI
ncbi:hypothetical protein JCM10207_001077 [Rhodosporidiobolus poonsookiae]